MVAICCKDGSETCVECEVRLSCVDNGNDGVDSDEFS